MDTRFTVNPTRVDPYRNFRFRLTWGGKAVAGFSQASGLADAPHVSPHHIVPHRTDGDRPALPLRGPGLSKGEVVTLERGVTHDADFQQWANSATHACAADFLRDFSLEVYDEAGQKAAAYMLHRCRPSTFQALPDLDANANAIAIEHLKLETDGWERRG